MSIRILTLAAALLAASAVVPAAAQMPPEQTPSAASEAASPRGERGERRGKMYASMSPAGRTTMWEAMRGGDPRGDRAAVKAARDRMLDIIDAPTLDVAALKRAMDDERRAAEAQQQRRQTAMLAAFQKLTPADRKAFVADSRALRDRFAERMQGRKGRRGGADGMAPPLPPQ